MHLCGEIKNIEQEKPTIDRDYYFGLTFISLASQNLLSADPTRPEPTSSTSEADITLRHGCCTKLQHAAKLIIGSKNCGLACLRSRRSVRSRAPDAINRLGGRRRLGERGSALPLCRRPFPGKWGGSGPVQSQANNVRVKKLAASECLDWPCLQGIVNQLAI
jgi:hypothetical protein